MPKYNLSVFEAVMEMAELNENREADPLLEGVDSNTSFKLGYATAIQDLQDLTGPDPMEVELVTAPVRDPEAHVHTPGDTNA